MNKVVDQVIEQSLKEQPLSIKSLVQNLLARKTLPHLAFVILACTGLHAIVRNGQHTIGGAGFMSLGIGYFLTAMMSRNETVSRWIKLPDMTQDKRRSIISFLKSFKICMFPVSLSGMVFLIFYIPMAPWLEQISMALGLLFILWSVGQGRSFKVAVEQWLKGKMKPGSLHNGNPRNSAIFQLIIIQTISFIGVWIAIIASELSEISLIDVITKGGVFIFASLCTQLIVLRWTRDVRLLVSKEKGLASFSFRWMIFSQLFINWHLLSIYRRWWLDPSDFATLLEESILMAVTVVLAIWALTSKSTKSGTGIVGEHNALPLGIAFGYSYAGSVSMLTVTFEDIRGVMMLGHALTLLTVLIIIKSTIKSTINSYDDTHEEDIQKQVPENKSDESTEVSSKNEKHENEIQEKENDEDSTESKELDSSSDDIGDNVNWDSPKENIEADWENED